MVFPVPEENREYVIAILGMLGLGAAFAMARLFGKDELQMREAERHIEEADGKIQAMACKLDRVRAESNERVTRIEAQYAELQKQYTELMSQLIRKHVIDNPTD